MSLGTYSHYQDSGADWLGKIPAHWTMKRLRFAVELNPSKSEISDLNRDSEVSFLPMEAIGDDGSLNVERTRPIREVETGYTYFREGDVTVAKITPCFENGKGALMRGLQGGIGFGTTELIVARPKHEHTSGDYLNWIFRSPGFRREGEASMYGAGGQKRVPDDFVRNFLWAFPPLPEQSAIAAFLNRETTKIDVLVAEQEKLLTLLAEKRQATISHAVTRGLDHEVPMKDSGVAWLGKVPAHWVRTPIKHTLRAIIDSEHKTAPFYEGGEYLVVRTSNVKNGTLVLDDAKYTDRASFKEWTTRGVPEPGDIVFTREAPAGEACIVPTEFPVCLGQRTVLMKTDKTRLNPYYGVWSIYGGLASEFVAVLAQGSTVAHFNMPDIGNIPILLPPLAKQSAIVAFIENEIRKLESLKAEAEKAIDLLKERRAALIGAAVTGKIDVRNVVRQELAA